VLRHGCAIVTLSPSRHQQPSMVCDQNAPSDLKSIACPFSPPHQARPHDMVARTKAEGRENDALQGCHRPDRGAARTTRSGSPERTLLLPKGIEPRDLSGFEFRDRQDIAEIGLAEERSVSDEGVGVDVASLPTQELLQVDVQSRLKGADRDGAGADPATDVRQ
jgi:hypothetical protein